MGKRAYFLLPRHELRGCFLHQLNTERAKMSQNNILDKIELNLTT